jgi:hypothetical protein
MKFTACKSVKKLFMNLSTVFIQFFVLALNTGKYESLFGSGLGKD